MVMHDGAAEASAVGGGCDRGKIQKRRKVGKQPDEKEKRRKVSPKPKPKPKPKKKAIQENHAGKGVNDDEEQGDDGEMGEDDSDEKVGEEAPPSKAEEDEGKAEEDEGKAEEDEGKGEEDEAKEGENDEEEDDEEKTKKGKKKGKSKAKAKSKSIRDQSKSKKLGEVWDSLPSEITDSWEVMSRADQTKLVNQGVVREGGKLRVDEAAMWAIVAEREETQKGKEKMKGYMEEDQGHLSTPLCHPNNMRNGARNVGTCFRSE